MWLVDVDGKNEQQVDDGDHLSAPAWAPDGKRLAWLHPVPGPQSTGRIPSGRRQWV